MNTPPTRIRNRFGWRRSEWLSDTGLAIVAVAFARWFLFYARWIETLRVAAE